MNPPTTTTPNVNPATRAILDNYKASNPTAASGGTSDWYSQLKAGAYRPTPVQSAPKPITTFGGDTQGSAGKEMSADIGQRVQNDKAINSSNENLPSKILGNLGEGAGAIGDVVTDAVKPLVPTPIKTGIKDVVGAVAKTPEAQAISKAWASFAAAHPEAAANIKATGNIASLLPIGEGIGQAGKAVEDVGEAGAKGIEKAVTTIKGTPEAQAAKQVAKNTFQLKSVADDWQKPTTIPGATFNKAKAVIAQNPDTPKFLAEQGLNPGAHVENGKFVTAHSAEALRNTAAKMSNETLRPSLQMADYSTPKTSVNELTDNAIKDIKANKTNTPGEAEAQISKAKSEGQALSRKYPNGMSLENMHDEKITYAGKGKYSPVGDTTVNNIANMNRSFGRTLGTAVEAKAPTSVPVHDANNYFSKYYKAADYLDELEGKKAPVSGIQQIARGVAKFGGAAIGGHFGGGVVSEFAGYQIGKALEHAAENLTNPMRAHFLSNLEKTNPAAFTHLQEYLRKANTGDTGVLRLPAPSSIQLAGHDELAKFNTPVKSEGSSVKSVPAERGLPNVNPKTNKFQSTYLSSPK